MTQAPTASALTLRVGEAIREGRARKGLSAAQVASRCGDLGVPIPTTGINKIETGRRGSLKLEEAIAFAHVLDLPLVSLIIPLGGPELDLLPNLRLSAWDAAKLITGEDSEGGEPEGSPRGVLEMFREHEVDVRTALISTRAARDRRAQAGKSPIGSHRYEELSSQTSEFERIAHGDCQRLLQTRERMRARRLCPAPLPDELDFVDPMTPRTTNN
ncbi:helix-turn-helix transcriptional regulator [Kitasatospora sp. NPDC048296]|uniref:helix-turn-helix transcriptional regulator n=1 Tax=Kitasatospora sp. NPDC048296 TaxID=3364048 RepID=UPI0037149431